MTMNTTLIPPAQLPNIKFWYKTKSFAFDEIVRLEADRNYTYIYFKNGSRLLSSKTLLLFEAELPNTHFIRINRNTIVNATLIAYYEPKSKTVVLNNGSAYEVARRRKSILMKWKKGVMTSV